LPPIQNNVVNTRFGKKQQLNWPKSRIQHSISVYRKQSFNSNESDSYHVYERIFRLLCRHLQLCEAGADPASKPRGAISVIFGSQVSLRFDYCKRMKYTSQHCCAKTMDDKMALYCECCFPNCTKSLWIKFIS